MERPDQNAESCETSFDTVQNEHTEEGLMANVYWE